MFVKPNPCAAEVGCKEAAGGVADGRNLWVHSQVAGDRRGAATWCGAAIGQQSQK